VEGCATEIGIVALRDAVVQATGIAASRVYPKCHVGISFFITDRTAVTVSVSMSVSQCQRVKPRVTAGRYGRRLYHLTFSVARVSLQSSILPLDLLLCSHSPCCGGMNQIEPRFSVAFRGIWDDWWWYEHNFQRDQSIPRPI